MICDIKWSPGSDLNLGIGQTLLQGMGIDELLEMNVHAQGSFPF